MSPLQHWDCKYINIMEKVGDSVKWEKHWLSVYLARDLFSLRLGNGEVGNGVIHRRGNSIFLECDLNK